MVPTKPDTSVERTDANGLLSVFSPGYITLVPKKKFINLVH